MKPKDDNPAQDDSATQLDENISRLVKLAGGPGKPGGAFTNSLVESAISELKRLKAAPRPRQSNATLTISQFEKAAAMIAVVCGAGFGILAAVLTKINALFAVIVLMGIFVNWLIYFGGLML